MEIAAVDLAVAATSLAGEHKHKRSKQNSASRHLVEGRWLDSARNPTTANCFQPERLRFTNRATSVVRLRRSCNALNRAAVAPRKDERLMPSAQTLFWDFTGI